MCFGSLGWLRGEAGCYFMTIILEGLNVGKANLQPESLCAFKFFRVTISDMRTYHKKDH